MSHCASFIALLWVDMIFITLAATVLKLNGCITYTPFLHTVHNHSKFRKAALLVSSVSIKENIVFV